MSYPLIAQALKTCAYELSPIAQAGKTCAAHVAPIAHPGSNELAHVAPIVHLGQAFADEMSSYRSSFENMCGYRL